MCFPRSGVGEPLYTGQDLSGSVWQCQELVSIPTQARTLYQLVKVLQWLRSLSPPPP